MLGSSPGKKRGCQGASAYQLRERGPKMPNRMGGGGGDEGKDNKMTIPDPLLGLSVATGTIKSKLDAQ